MSTGPSCVTLSPINGERRERARRPEPSVSIRYAAGGSWTRGRASGPCSAVSGLSLEVGRQHDACQKVQSQQLTREFSSTQNINLILSISHTDEFL